MLKLFQAEMFSRQQILHSIISDGQRMLEQGQVDDRWATSSQSSDICLCNIQTECLYLKLTFSRDEFKLKLALLSNQWQGVVRRAQQRRGIIDSLLRQWQRYREMVEKLRKWLVEASHQAETLQAGAPVPLQQARAMLDAVQVSIVWSKYAFVLAVSAPCWRSVDFAAKGEGFAEATGQLHLDGGGRETAASVCWYTGRSRSTRGAARHTGALETRQHPPGGAKERAGCPAKGRVFCHSTICLLHLESLLLHVPGLI